MAPLNTDEYIRRLKEIQSRVPTWHPIETNELSGALIELLALLIRRAEESMGDGR